MKDGPDKTILGAIQKSWLQETLESSDATFKLVISPTPIVGSDKANKSDNHSNEGFKTEGDALRKFLSGIDNCFVVNGDRHWQYVSTDPVTGLREYGTGPINAEHNYGGAIRFNERYHHYLALKGGYLSIQVKRVDGVPRITFQYHDIDALDPQTGRSKIVYQETVTAKGFGL
jgi:alkaline phosphatase D